MLATPNVKQGNDSRFQYRITLSNDVQEVSALNEFIDGMCETLGLDMTTTMQMNLAIEEAVVNVMTYAYPAGVKGDVDIEAFADDKYLKIVIRDRGKAFDPTAQEEADTTLSAEERPIGGLGIHLVRQLMDTIDYRREDGLNVLTLCKKLNTNG